MVSLSKSLVENGLKNLVKILDEMSGHEQSTMLSDSNPCEYCNGVSGQQVVQRSNFFYEDWETAFGPDETDDEKISLLSSSSLRLVVAARMQVLQAVAPDLPSK